MLLILQGDGKPLVQEDRLQYNRFQTAPSFTAQHRGGQGAMRDACQTSAWLNRGTENI